MFQFPEYAHITYVFSYVLLLKNSRVSPFGNFRIKACLVAPRNLSHPTTSFIAHFSQGIHCMPFVTFFSTFYVRRHKKIICIKKLAINKNVSLSSTTSFHLFFWCFDCGKAIKTVKRMIICTSPCLARNMTSKIALTYFVLLF